MSELGGLLRSAVNARADKWGGAQPSESVRRSITRARIVRLGSVGVVAGALLVGVGAAGMGLAGGEPVAEPSPTMPVDLSLDPTVEYATVPFPEEWVEAGMASDDQWCGSAPPVTDTNEEEFAAEFDPPAHLELDPMQQDRINTGIHATLMYTGDEELPLFVEAPRALFLADGKVVGWVPWHEPAPLTKIVPGYTMAQAWEWPPTISSCDGDQAYGELPAGVYDVVLVWDARNDPPTAATHALRMAGYTLPPKSEIPAYRQGGYECQDSQVFFTAVPITCEPRAIPGLTIDDEAGAVTIPYDPSNHVRDVDLRFVSEPFRVTLKDRDLDRGALDWDALPQYEPGVVPACGDVYSHDVHWDLSGTLPAAALDMRSIEVGDVLEPTLWLRTLGWSAAEVDMPPTSRLWVMKAEEILAEDGAASLRFHGTKVVGWIDARNTQAGPVTLDRYEGPEPWSLEVTETGWCEDAGDPGPFVALLLGTPVLFAVDGEPPQSIEPLIFTR